MKTSVGQAFSLRRAVSPPGRSTQAGHGGLKARRRLKACPTLASAGELLLLTLLLLGACDRANIAPWLSTGLDVKQAGANRAAILVHVKNEKSRGTVPIDVQVTAEPRTAAGWGVPVTVIHPAPFVLNGQESRDIRALVPASSALRCTLTVKEAERGLPVATRTEVLGQAAPSQ
jgi:hypothetical protein